MERNYKKNEFENASLEYSKYNANRIRSINISVVLKFLIPTCLFMMLKFVTFEKINFHKTKNLC